MICTSCSKNEAMLFLSRKVDGVRAPISLCAPCTEDVGLTAVLERLEVMARKEASGKSGESGLWFDELPIAFIALCPCCGARLDEIRRQRQFGCEECYRLFGGLLAGVAPKAGTAPREEAAPGEAPQKPKTTDGGAHSDDKSWRKKIRPGTDEEFSELFYAAALEAKPEKERFYLESRVECRRNVAGSLFPHKMDSAQRARLAETIYEALSGVPGGPILEFREGRLSPIQTALLCREAFWGRRSPIRRGARILKRKNCNATFMVNGQDHLIVSAAAEGLSLEKLDGAIAERLAEAEKSLEWAVSPRYGHLTVSPLNVGSGVSRSLLVHAPLHMYFGKGYELQMEAEKRRMGLRPLTGASIEGHGFFRLSNINKRDRSESDQVDALLQFGETIRKKEIELGGKLKNEDLRRIKKVSRRSLKLALDAHRLSYCDVLRQLSFLELARENKLMKMGRFSLRAMLRAHLAVFLQFGENRAVTVNECDQLRAKVFADNIAGLLHEEELAALS